MKQLKEVLEGLKRGPRDVVGLDIGTSGVKAVRMRAQGGEHSIVAADILPHNRDAGNVSSGDPSEFTPLSIPQKLRARHAVLAFTGQSAIIKLLSFPGVFDEKAEEKVVDNMGLDDADRYRISYAIISEGHARSEARVLTVALPEEEANVVAPLLPQGAPAPFSLEISGLSTMTALLNALDEKRRTSAIAVVDCGETTTTYGLFNRGLLTLVRRFGFGTGALLERVQTSLGVDRETAQGIITDGSFDISTSISEVLEPLIKQLMVSRDFVERRENCRVTSLFVSGSLAKSHDAVDEISSSLEIDVEFWNPLEGITVKEDAFAPELQGQEWRFAGAIGACQGAFEAA